jgi:hypothetical protein
MSKTKPWSKSASGRAPSSSRERRRVLIVCEDSKSSTYYFKAFPIDPHRLEVKVLGTGMNTDSLVQEATRIVHDDRKQGILYNEVWCVFDHDSFPLQNYTRAFDLAAREKIKIAWANEAFELWYLLHFDFHNSPISRNAYKQKLLQKGLTYDKADKAIYQKVKPYQDTAMKNASKLEKHWNECGEKFPERKNPSTSVHNLVEFLNELANLGRV